MSLLVDPLYGQLVDVPMNLADVQRELAKRAGHKIDGYFPESGPYRRELYPKHLAFMAAGGQFRERCFLAANQVGKSEMGAFEMTCHLTGIYPAWWAGKQFDRPVRAWAAGDTSKTVRGILQVKLLGEVGQMGTGMLPHVLIDHVSRKAGVADAYEQVWVTHVTGGKSHLELKSYDQRREAFQGAVIDVIWLDEEPPREIYTECLLRTATTDGILYMTFTPLMGTTQLILDYMAEQETLR